MSKCLNSVLFKTPAISPSPLSVVLGPGRGVASFMSWINGLWWWWLTRLALLPRPRFALLRNRNRQWEWEWQARAFTNWSGPGPLLSRRWRGQSHRASFFRSRWFKKKNKKIPSRSSKSRRQKRRTDACPADANKCANKQRKSEIRNDYRPPQECFDHLLLFVCPTEILAEKKPGSYSSYCKSGVQARWGIEE